MFFTVIMTVSFANADILKFSPRLGVFDSGVINIDLDYATCNDMKWDAEEIIPSKTKIFYTLKCLEIEYDSGTTFYHIIVIIDKIIEDKNIINGPFVMYAVAKNNGALSFWKGINNSYRSINLLSKLLQPLAMSFYYPNDDLDQIVMWSKKYNWPRKSEFEMTFNGDFYIKQYNSKTVDVKNDVYFVLKELNGHITSNYTINRKFSSIDELKARCTLRYDIEDDRIVLFLDIYKGEE